MINIKLQRNIILKSSERKDESKKKPIWILYYGVVFLHAFLNYYGNRLVLIRVSILPTNRMISKTVTIQSANMTLKATPMLIPSMSMG
jgi:hypothetical protein